MSMFGDYIMEHRGEGIVEREEGFATYRFIDDKDAGVTAVYIVDIYTRPDFRKTNVASEIADEIVEIGKKRGCKRVLGTVVPSAKHSTDSIKVLLGYGMKLHSATNDLVVFYKEII